MRAASWRNGATIPLLIGRWPPSNRHSTRAAVADLRRQGHMHQGLSASAERRLLVLATGRPASMDDDDVEELIAHDHVSRHPGGRVEVTASGHAYLARRQ